MKFDKKLHELCIVRCMFGKKMKKIRRQGKSKKNLEENQDEKGQLRMYRAKLEQNQKSYLLFCQSTDDNYGS